MWQVALVLGFYGGIISRIHGGGFGFHWPKTVKNLLWALPLAVVGCTALYRVDDFYPLWYYDHGRSVANAIMLLSFAFITATCLLGKATGHGGGMDLAHSDKEPGAGREPEKLEYMILWLHDKLPRFWYDALLLTIVGAAAVSGIAIILGMINVWAGLIVLLGGALKSVAYILGWRFAVKMSVDLDEPTEFGELLTGFAAYGAGGIAVYVCGAL